jgi:hypothetical protein
MINLLPPEIKSSYHYSRRNVVLRKWVALFAVALLGLGGLATYGMLTLHQSTLHYEQRIATTEATFKREKYSETQTKIKDISSSFKLVVQVLSQEVLFSQLIKQVATAIPANSNLTGLNISQTKGGIDITAEATDYRTATQVQVNLSDPQNKIFSKADIITINCNGAVTTNPRYPCTVNIRALFNKDNPFLLISNVKATKR